MEIVLNKSPLFAYLKPKLVLNEGLHRINEIGGYYIRRFKRKKKKKLEIFP